MSEPDNFLSRWSRLKRSAADSQGEPEAPAAEAGAADAPAALPDAQQVQDLAQDANASAAPAEAEFDLASLPSLDSIAADTDIRAFLQPGVPGALRHAALRRAWSADPAIRDFRGLQENDWDFNDPESIPGFGKLGPDFDVRKMVSRIFADEPDNRAIKSDIGPQLVEGSEQFTRDQDAPAVAETPPTPTSNSSLPPSEHEMMQREDNVAMHQREPDDSGEQGKPRRHGGALPR